MKNQPHRVIFTTNNSDKSGFIAKLLLGDVPEGFGHFRGKEAGLFSSLAVNEFIEEEIRHDRKILTGHTRQSLQSMSSGERKKALLHYLLESGPGFLILDNPFDNLDTASREMLKKELEAVAKKIPLVQIISRTDDRLPFITTRFRLEGMVLSAARGIEAQGGEMDDIFPHHIPGSPEPIDYKGEFVVRFKKIRVSYGSNPILNNINWDIRPGEFWELTGANGSGKTTLLTMITGDNPKAYGQELYLFGLKKGSGESIWEIKRKIGYFTPAMIDRFTGYHSLEHMLLSGLVDSIGLYVYPTEMQVRLAREWLSLIGMEAYSQARFHDLTMGQQRLVMCARAMIKQPLLLILDEPTADLDDASARLFVSLVNRIAEEKKVAVIFVSHRKEPCLKPHFIFHLERHPGGSIGAIR